MSDVSLQAKGQFCEQFGGKHVNYRVSENCVQFCGSMVDVGVNECNNTINGKSQFVCLVLVHLLLIGLNGTNGKYVF